MGGFATFSWMLHLVLGIILLMWTLESMGINIENIESEHNVFFMFAILLVIIKELIILFLILIFSPLLSKKIVIKISHWIHLRMMI